MKELFNCDCTVCDSLWPKYKKINDVLSGAGLNKISDFPDIAEFPCVDDYWLHPLISEKYPDISNWIENGEEYKKFCGMHDKVNSLIEQYLSEIDKKYKTSYCPSGATRLY